MFRDVFNTPGGKEVLAALDAELNHPNIVGADPHMTYYKLGQRDIVMYIHEMLNAGAKNE